MATAQPTPFGALLRRYRVDANLSQEALAERARMSVRAISDLERGVRRLPYRDTVRQLAAALALDTAAQTALLNAARGPRAPRKPQGDEGAADDPLLETKLALPPRRPLLVTRPRLGQRLQQALQGPLTLIAAPAGSGKTTLLSAWRDTPAGRLTPMAWVSLDAADNDPARFWHYVLAALERVTPGSGAAAMALLGPARSGGTRESRPIEVVLTGLVNALSARTTPLVLALDDYHLIEAPAIHMGLAFLLDHLPSCLHLLLISRADPPLALSRWRVRGSIVELRAADLRFTLEEADAFFREVMGLPLAPADIAALEVRTEGWIAGLQLAALALQGRPAEATAPFIDTFTGSNRYVVDYLAEEVLARQPAAVQDFLMHTCILDRLCAGLCAAVLDEGGPGAEAASQALLEELERSNVFLIALDDERRWYRYHHLFADALRGRLGTGRGPAAELIHRRAGDWLEGQGFRHEAIGHLLAANAAEPAAELIEQVAITLVMQGAWQTLASWLDALPDRLLRARPRLCVIRALLQLDRLSVDSVESYLRDAEQALRNAQPRDDDRNTRGEIAALYATVSVLRGDVATVVAHAHEALECLDITNDTMRGIASTCLGAGYIGQGDLARAEQTFALTITAARASGNVGIGLAVTEDLTYLQRVRGKLDAAIKSCEEALAWSASYDALAHPFNAAVHLSLTDLWRERNDLSLAAYHLDEAFARSTAWNLLISQVFSLVVRARLQGAQGDPVAALATLNEAADLAPHQVALWIAPVLDAYRVQLWLAHGRLDLAADLVTRAGPTAMAPQILLSSQFTIYTYEHLAVAPIQVLLAQGRAMSDPVPLRAALDLATQQRRQAETAGIPWSRIKAIALQALAWDALGEGERAVALLLQAVTLAATERYIRLFVDEGAPMAALLARTQDLAGSDGRSATHLSALLAACRGEAGA